MKELVIISGKGGTGKTSVTGSFAALARNAVLADCDVDAADLYLLLNPDVQEQHEFFSGHEAVIRENECTGCGQCMELCRFDAVIEQDGTFRINPFACEGCGVCVQFCPAKAIDFPECLCGNWFHSDTRYGPMVHAKLEIAAENSGKLVNTVRQQAKQLAEKTEADWLIIDGPPGTGCPVIASIGGTDAVLVITEPTLSGKHDLLRVLELTRHFKIPAFISVNKWDINPEMSARIEDAAVQAGATVLERIPYDASITHAQIQARSIVEWNDGPAATSIKTLWEKICQNMK
ncbi:ATP-binding protein [Tichowtungia aerotolerans]|uniref:4Fe-4S dicluster domain-containing protein n=1 Tax=Tichowtungia aerotolerans TaxID=2697043 RepID=A0A6P1M6H0_9BACT|nr:ATP-binding protein [Tichowtungia aerotolerans]QHI69457.1 4Fe-4S dicluster domain-containing protein [Tichowtungia aerotolerans]